MRIAFISLFKRGYGGGEGRIAHEMAEYFARSHDVVLICPGDTTELTTAPHGLRRLTIQSAGEGDVYFPALSHRQVIRIYDLLDDLQPEVIHAHEPALLGLVGQIWARLHNVPFVYTAHVLPSKALSFGAADIARIFRSPVTEAVARTILQNFYRNCDAVVGLNSAAIADIRRFGYRGRILIIPNGRSLDRYTHCAVADITSDKKELTYIGFISQRKNQGYLTNMLRELPDRYTLHLIGKSLDAQYERRLRDAIAGLRRDRVVFEGQIDHEDVPAYLERTHVFVSASLMEIQSLVIIEALASGTPVVGLSNETIDELVDDRVGLRLPKDASPLEFARAVEMVCSQSRTAYAEMCAEARARVCHLDWSNIMAATIVGYKSLALPAQISLGDARGSLARSISSLPDADVRDMLTRRLDALRQSIEERILSEPKGQLTSSVRSIRRVPSGTWLLAGLTIPVSLAGYLFMKSRLSARRRRKETGFGRGDTSRRLGWWVLSHRIRGRRDEE